MFSDRTQPNISTCIQGEFERNYREKGTNKREISNAVDSQMKTNFEDIVLQHIMFIDT